LTHGNRARTLFVRLAVGIDPRHSHPTRPMNMLDEATPHNCQPYDSQTVDALYEEGWIEHRHAYGEVAAQAIEAVASDLGYQTRRLEARNGHIIMIKLPDHI
jgi:hypothetical protein